jgi:hypothetical protein
VKNITTPRKPFQFHHPVWTRFLGAHPDIRVDWFDGVENCI